MTITIRGNTSLKGLTLKSVLKEIVHLYTLDNPDPKFDDSLGWSIATTDAYTVVGAPYKDDAGGTGSGKAYIFNTTTGALLHTLDNPNDYGTSKNDHFGYSVAITDTYTVVGAPDEDDASGGSTGKVYVYNTVTGALVRTNHNPNDYGTSVNDKFGTSVAMTDTYIVVGAPGEDDAGGTGSGKAYIFNTVSGTIAHTLDNPSTYGTSADDKFGWSVAITDNYTVVGAPYEADAGGTGSGKAYIFNTTTGALLQTLDNPNPLGTSFNDEFGTSVAMNSTYTAISASREDDAGGTQSGRVYIYNTASGVLLYTINNPNAYSASTSDDFGTSIALTNTHMVVGAEGEDDGVASSGVAYIFTI